MQLGLSCVYLDSVCLTSGRELSQPTNCTRFDVYRQILICMNGPLKLITWGPSSCVAASIIGVKGYEPKLTYINPVNDASIYVYMLDSVCIY